MRRNNKVFKLIAGSVEKMTIGTVFSGTSDIPLAVEISISGFFGRFRLTMDDFYKILPDFARFINDQRVVDLQCSLSTVPNELYHIKFYGRLFRVYNNHGEILYTANFDTITDVSDTTCL